MEDPCDVCPKAGRDRCVFVAAWFDVVNPWKTIEPWCTTPIDCHVARAALEGHAAPLIVLLSNNDRYTPDFTSNALRWEKDLGAEVLVLEQRAHFAGRNQPDVLAASMRMIQHTHPGPSLHKEL